ncbi:GRIM-19 protein [Ancylostoma caninum]|uniref:NADH dehydrogenase [ubiquinone] 1 alpha subcomplex subunit 13 n=1 Tax=Ancylostoma caninum TaxID=29170 RepID=A0A368F1B1_ANCCA|nr:GRIM-19 protein [Ancylostoma caninum]
MIPVVQQTLRNSRFSDVNLYNGGDRAFIFFFQMAETGFRQDMPPSGGYRKFNYGRTFPKVFWRPGVVVAAVFGATVYGSFDAIAKKKARVTEKFEDIDITNAMQPFLTAERDRFWLKLLKKNRELEEEVMKDVPGWKTGALSFALFLLFFSSLESTSSFNFPFISAEKGRGN